MQNINHAGNIEAETANISQVQNINEEEENDLSDNNDNVIDQDNAEAPVPTTAIYKNYYDHTKAYIYFHKNFKQN